MKIRTDFVTNSSSSSFVTVTVKSKKLAEFLETKVEEIESYNDGYCDVEISIEGSTVTVQTGDSDVCFDGGPSELSEFLDALFELIRLEEDEEAADFAETFDALQCIDSIEWCEETMGLDGDDGRWDKSNYTPDALQAVLDEIAECNDCSVEEITDEMFNEHVTPEADDVISSSTYSYSKKTGKSISTYKTIMESSQKETNEK